MPLSNAPGIGDEHAVEGQHGGTCACNRLHGDVRGVALAADHVNIEPGLAGRLQGQAQRILTQMDPDNRIEPAALPAETQKELKRVLSHIKALQAGLDHDFAGA